MSLFRRVSDMYEASYPPSILGGGLDPHINSLVPDTVNAAAGPITVTVNGTNFDVDAVVEIDGAAQATTRVSGTVLTISYDPTVAGTVLFTVRNVGSAQESNDASFVVGALAEEPTAAPEVVPTDYSSEPSLAESVANWTVAEVQAYVQAHPETIDEVYGIEQAGRARSTLLAWLESGAT